LLAVVWGCFQTVQLEKLEALGTQVLKLVSRNMSAAGYTQKSDELRWPFHH